MSEMYLFDFEFTESYSKWEPQHCFKASDGTDCNRSVPLSTSQRHAVPKFWTKVTLLLIFYLLVDHVTWNLKPYSFINRFKEWGFEKGWGDTAERTKETMKLLSEVLQAPDPLNLERFFSRLPTIFNVVIFSPHGYFGQADVLGLPDTGGQV